MNATRMQWRLEFGVRLADARIEAGMTQGQLSRALGMHPNMVGHYEQGAHEPTAYVLAEICRIIGASADEVLGIAAARDDGGKAAM